jgi:hypothetical protein
VRALLRKIGIENQQMDCVVVWYCVQKRLVRSLLSPDFTVLSPGAYGFRLLWVRVRIITGSHTCGTSLSRVANESSRAEFSSSSTHENLSRVEPSS